MNLATTKKQLSKMDAVRVGLFTELITKETSGELLRKALSKLYFAHTRLLIKTIGTVDDVFINNDTDTGLHYLSEIIDILDAGNSD